MDEIRIRDLSAANVEDLCRLCVPIATRDDPAYVIGMELKRRWAMDMLQKWGACAKLAYMGTEAVGLIQYEPIPEEGVIHIHCLYVPEQEYWQKGIATRLLSSLVEEMKAPQAWFGDRPTMALATRTFSGEKAGQYPARRFFVGMGFQQVAEDPDFLYASLEQGFAYQPAAKKAVEYVPQAEDRGRATIIYGPSFCPFAYVFLKQAAQTIQEVAPGLSVRWIDRSKEPEEGKKRGNFEGCVVNARPIRSFVLDKESFQREVAEALLL
jgi:N-acetylglutamate synthase-like GNAT family acetyltransferase